MGATYMKHKGPSVDLVDSSGSDLTVANSARVSFNKTSDWDYVDNGAFGQKRVLSERELATRHFVGKTIARETYRKEQEPRTRRRKIEEERANEVTIPSKQQLDKLLTTEDAELDYYPES